MCSVVREQTLTDDYLHTLFCEIEAIVNSRPITRVPGEVSDLEPLTPNHLLQLKSDVNLSPAIAGKLSQYAKRRWRQVQYLADLFWRRWTAEYLPQLLQRQKWVHPKRNAKEGDVVLIVNEATPRNAWPLGRVIETLPGSDGLVRRVKVKTKSNVLVRPIDKLCLLLEAEIPEQGELVEKADHEERSHRQHQAPSLQCVSNARPRRGAKPVKRLDL